MIVDDNFKKVAPVLGLMPRRVKNMSLEQVGLVESNRISTDMVHPSINQATFLKDHDDLEEMLCIRVADNIGGLILSLKIPS